MFELSYIIRMLCVLNLILGLSLISFKLFDKFIDNLLKYFSNKR